MAALETTEGASHPGRSSSPLSSVPSSPLSSPAPSPEPPSGMAFPLLPRRLAPYPSPESSQNGSPTPHGMETDGPPPAKRRRISRDPKERTTEHLDLRSGSVDSVQQEELDRLLQVLHKRQKIVVIAGAGMSVSAGIPDFRSPDGLFKTLKEEHKIKGSGKDLFDASVYKDDTSTSLFHSMVTSLSRSTKDAKPTAFHHMLATIAKEGRLLRLYSQNVDALDTGLEPLATRIPFTKDEDGKWPATVQLHGSLEKMVCSKCHHLANFDVELFEEAGAMPPLCPECETVNNIRTNNLGKRSHGVGRMRPRMVLYNEQHPDAVAIGSCTSHDLKRRPDAVIVVGTTLKVPGVQRIVQEMCATVRDRKDGGLAIWINQDLPPTFKQFNNCFDIIVQSSCDEVARRAAMRKWYEEPVPDDFSEVSEEDAQKAASRKLHPHLPTPPQSKCPLTAAALAQLPSLAHINNSFRPPEPDATPVKDPESLRPGNWSPLTNRKPSIFESIETDGEVVTVADGMLTPSKSTQGSSRRSTPAKVSNVNEKLMNAAQIKKAAPQKPTATRSKSSKTGQPHKRRNVKFVKAPASKAKAASKAKTVTKAQNAAQPKKNSLAKSQHFTATKTAAVDARSAAKKTLLSPAKSPSGLRNVSNASDMLSSVSERNARVNTSPSKKTAFFPNLAAAAENPAPGSKTKLGNMGD
ncbi:DHS-like NAD/FAD-binding domain-containing protein [Teratosphaeria nubilosa]|uniref:DHS-like NAD/FAD-binding domain-containing protein n=1 Tax=Teratosphaeria nubilosa TaxID=161662 RepID=A0A6G1LDZ0_9PEZI|nr:DHS-like NAD/FAD-binding domain-containing protein [Teratosphaeria nubilosa]